MSRHIRAGVRTASGSPSFPSRQDENENDQLWILSSAGGEAEQLTREKGSVDDFAWAPDSKRIVLVVHDPDPREPEAKEKEKKTVPPIVIDRFQFKEDIGGYITNRWSHLKLLDLASRRLDALTSGQHDDVLPAWSPNGKEIAFVTKRGVDSGRTENWDVYLIEAKVGAKERQLTTTPEADAHPDWESAPAWSPDGKTIAFIHGGDPKKIEYATHSLSIIPAAGGEAKILTANLDRNVVQPHWAPDGKSIFVVLEDDGAETLVRVPADFADGGAVPGDPPIPVVGGRRKITAYDVSSNGRVIVRASTPDRPFEIFAAENNDLRDLTKQNDAFFAQIQLGRVEETKFKSADGTEVHGFLVHPPNETAGRKNPTLLRPHGGPQSQYANEFDFEKQLFAANGYAVVMPNPRGSTGRGTDYAMGIYASWGGVDVQDDLAAVDDADCAWDRRSGAVGGRGVELRRDVDKLSHRHHDPLQSGRKRRVDFQYSGRLRDRPIHPRLRIRARVALGSIPKSGRRFPIRSCTRTRSRRRPCFSVAKTITTFRSSIANRCIRRCER